MATDTFNVGASADDWQTPPYNDSATTMEAQQNNVLVPSVSMDGYCKIDTSGLPSAAIIQSITFNWYDHSYSKSRRTLDSRIIWINDSNTGATYVNMYSNTFSLTSGWQSTTTTNSTHLAKVNKSGYTYFRFSVEDPGASKYRIWNIRAWDYSGDDTNACYLDVTYTLGGRRYHVQIT